MPTAQCEYAAAPVSQHEKFRMVSRPQNDFAAERLQTIEGVEPAGHFFNGICGWVAGAVALDFSQRDGELQP